ncbi:hypothetical protein M404DRAFT_1006328 [Pisolithus tinctorius Marx 270]|uniref:Uncharacterized protein n=1 Tax=Pisolithus tinctorius Marx 270 TaxID=870435 RepID=A0A0C3IJ83_PISTI|nr:hypothetical protein M404DRAFT_1006328 [Pisolithus tinctorius Marx 270]
MKDCNYFTKQGEMEVDNEPYDPRRSLVADGKDILLKSQCHHVRKVQGPLWEVKMFDCVPKRVLQYCKRAAEKIGRRG